MAATTEDTICEVCGAAATIHLADTQAGTEHLYCPDHKPALAVGERSPRLVIKRFRMPPDNPCSQRLAAPKDSPEHKSLRREICDLRLLGDEGACRYYLSIITDTDQFALWDDMFVNNVREYVVSRTCKAASRLCDNLHSLQFLAGFLRRACERCEGTYHDRRGTKQERAIELLLKHPDWSDEQIASHVPTTMKQLQRWIDFTGLRNAQKR